MLKCFPQGQGYLKGPQDKAAPNKQEPSKTEAASQVLIEPGPLAELLKFGSASGRGKCFGLTLGKTLHERRTDIFSSQTDKDFTNQTELGGATVRGKRGENYFPLGRPGGSPIVFGEEFVHERDWNMLSGSSVSAGVLFPSKAFLDQPCPQRRHGLPPNLALCPS